MPAVRRDPPELTESWLQAEARRHLERYWPSVAQLRRVLMRRVDRALAAHGGGRADGLAMVERVLASLRDDGHLDDGRFVDAWVDELHRKGNSARVIQAKMAAKGVDGDLVRAALGRREGDDPEVDAARAYVRRRRLGPHRTDPTHRAARREKDLAAVARAGFGFEVALRVIDEDDRQ